MNDAARYDMQKTTPNHEAALRTIPRSRNTIALPKRRFARTHTGQRAKHKNSAHRCIRAERLSCKASECFRRPGVSQGAKRWALSTAEPKLLRVAWRKSGSVYDGVTIQGCLAPTDANRTDATHLRQESYKQRFGMHSGQLPWHSDCDVKHNAQMQQDQTKHPSAVEARDP